MNVEPPTGQYPGGSRMQLASSEDNPRNGVPERHTDAGGRGWAAPHLVDQTKRDHLLSVALALVILLLVAACDLVLIKSTFDHVLRNRESLSWLLAAGLTTASVALMFISGSESRVIAAEGGTRASRFKAALLVGAWVALGLGLFWLRWNAAGFTQAVVNYGGAQDSSQPSREFYEQLLAVVMLAVYLATGSLAAADGFRLTNRAATALRRARTKVAQLQPKVAEKSGRVKRLREGLELHQHDLDTIEEHRATAHSARKALIAELKEHARVQIAMQLANPSATDGIRHEPLGGAS